MLIFSQSFKLGIYRKWAILIQSISQPQGQKKKLFAAKQEGARKDVERCFGVLLARFAIIKGPARFWKKGDLHAIMTACVILHNKIVDDACELAEDNVELEASPTAVQEESTELSAYTFHTILKHHKDIEDAGVHSQLRYDLIEHLWQQKG